MLQKCTDQVDSVLRDQRRSLIFPMKMHPPFFWSSEGFFFSSYSDSGIAWIISFTISIINNLKNNLVWGLPLGQEPIELLGCAFRSSCLFSTLKVVVRSRFEKGCPKYYYLSLWTLSLTFFLLERDCSHLLLIDSSHAELIYCIQEGKSTKRLSVFFQFILNHNKKQI